ncbi:aminodeoxychorismate synthase component I [Clostridium septicum]|uniref:Anthranilate synthase component 1 n=1 Tax=Clostridium septicum TaxID=1504 RepID=A0A9N7JN33_CLOSE|nr:aminodeoxychorismate synthase component I [Clostridium septicum]AYE35365.1 aminodeoxychorismate synthase, component I [Clostridium septicum]MDU1315085.1 aminodeoxychorismate synthase component I [Clostridium septicum]QAS60756.1 aminodeoxychorismate synthase component I [Clostridium septicum]UEC19980.1 aminodeoxychorismate synthase component I [Clostridium septicum]USS01962.1 aminodeoxychorismate synthase component I [Clostridium septicum]
MDLNIREIVTSLNPLEVYNIFKDKKNSILLDSSKDDRLLSKFSFIGINEFLKFESKGNKAFINDKEITGNPFNILESLISKYRIVEDKYDEIPFLSGCIGYISYDTCRILEDLPNTSKEDFIIPDMRFSFYDNLIIFDLINNKKYITSLGVVKNSEKSLDEIECKIKLGVRLNEEDIEGKNKNFNSNFTKKEYKNAISKLKDYIISGDVYIANMTQRFFCDCNDDAFKIYKRLRSINKAPFSAFMNYDDFQVISSSPERFIQVKDRKVHTRPIKGTRPRGNTKEEDYKNSQELLNSEKDKAELLMVVDLERNDLSKVCKNHSVKVTELFKLEEYATVFHLVSTVEGELKEEVSAVECIRECFPGGSITGTPKIRAMEIIEELEGVKRNLYTGSIGYFDLRGNSDFNIVIRTIVKKENKAYFGVGGGITYDSIEEDEYNETLDKAKALMRVL